MRRPGYPPLLWSGSGTTTYTANALNQYSAVGDVNYTYSSSGKGSPNARCSI
jgi:hypothetical protein